MQRAGGHVEPLDLPVPVVIGSRIDEQGFAHHLTFDSRDAIDRLGVAPADPQVERAGDKSLVHDAVRGRPRRERPGELGHVRGEERLGSGP